MLWSAEEVLDWVDNIKEWTYLPMPELLTRVSCRKGWKRISAESFVMSPPHPPPTPDDPIAQGTELNWEARGGGGGGVFFMSVFQIIVSDVL